MLGVRRSGVSVAAGNFRQPARSVCIEGMS